MAASQDACDVRELSHRAAVGLDRTDQILNACAMGHVELDASAYALGPLPRAGQDIDADDIDSGEVYSVRHRLADPAMYSADDGDP